LVLLSYPKTRGITLVATIPLSYSRGWADVESIISSNLRITLDDMYSEGVPRLAKHHPIFMKKIRALYESSVP
jgi:hypothetical protein